MYFNENRGNTNIDDQFDSKTNFNLKEFITKNKKLLIIIGSIALIAIIVLIILFINRNSNAYFITLEGSEEMMIYKDSVYNEPGYSGFDKKRNDLTNNVIIEGSVNSSQIGTYTITYKLNKTIKTRIIKVIAKPAKETLIYLSSGTNGGSTLVRLKVGQKYNEPGYSAIDTIDGDLTSKVKITNKVDTSKKGTYKIVYSVVNSHGVTTSAVRTVIVE